MEPDEEVEPLVDQGLERAEASLVATGTLVPFAIILRDDRPSRFLEGWRGETPPPADDVLAGLMWELRSRAAAGRLRGCAVFLDVCIAAAPGAGGPRDGAIAVGVEHRAGYARSYVHPYHLEGGRLMWGAPQGRVRVPEVFAPDA